MNESKFLGCGYEFSWLKMMKLLGFNFIFLEKSFFLDNYV